MNGLNFTDKDSENLIDFLNFIAQKAEFNKMSLQDNIKFYGLLNWTQKSLLEKIKANILEIKKVEKLTPEKKVKAKA